MNGGHKAGIEASARDGVKVGREWLAIDDNDTREDHADANGQAVGPGEMFVVGGEETPYPGWYGLSALQRINCRCTMLATGLGDASDNE